MITKKRFVASVCALGLLLGLGACSKGDDDAKDFCKKYRTYEDQNKELARTTARSDQKVDLDDVHSRYDRVADQLHELDSTAPDEIKGAVGTLRKAFDELNTKVQDSSSATELVQALKGVVDDKSLDAPNDKVTKWIDDNCDASGDTKG